MTDSDLKTVAGKPGDPMFEACFDLMEIMHAATTPYLEDRFADPRDALSTLMTAANMFAGTQAGTLMAIGAFRSQDRKRIGEAALTNFRQGLDVGLQRAQQIGADISGGSA